MLRPKTSISPIARTYSNASKLRRNLNNTTTMSSLNNDLSRYDDLIKKARDIHNTLLLQLIHL